MNTYFFKNLVIIIFNKTLGIRPFHNDKRGAYTVFFSSYQLGRDLEKIEKNEPLPEPDIYTLVLKQFFEEDPIYCVERTQLLLDSLIRENYIKKTPNTNIQVQCTKNTLSYYRDLIFDIWDFYYKQYSSSNAESFTIYEIPESILINIENEYNKFHLPSILESYEHSFPNIAELLKSINPNTIYSNIEPDYLHFFKYFIEEDLISKLSSEEKNVFFNTLYAISDILNRIHHKDAYDIDLEILTFFNKMYNDDFTTADIVDIRRIQGCLYAICIEPTDESLKGNIQLTKNNNLTKRNTNYEPFPNRQLKFDWCNIALHNLLNHYELKKLDAELNDAIYIRHFENRYKKNQSISTEELNKLIVLSLIYSNISVCALQYIKYGINTKNKNEYIYTCESYHEFSEYIRTLIIRITEKTKGNESPEYADALHFLATYYHSVATRCYYTNDFANVILIRSILYSFYMTLGIKDKARTQLELSPIERFKENGGDSKLYEQKKQVFIKKHKPSLKYLSEKELFSYEEYSKLVSEYEEFKKKF